MPETTMSATTQPMSNEARIRELTAEWLRAVRAKDMNAVMRHYATDLIAFDVIPPLSFKGADLYRQHWQDWFDSINGPVGFEMTDLQAFVVAAYVFADEIGSICAAAGGQARCLAGGVRRFTWAAAGT